MVHEVGPGCSRLLSREFAFTSRFPASDTGAGSCPVNPRRRRTVPARGHRPVTLSTRHRTGLILWISLALIAVTAGVFAPLAHFDFVKWDDAEYVTGNPDVLAGLSWRGVVWAFTTNHGPYWHPLTWLSHMLDVQLFGLNAGGHHVTNIVLHIATTLLLFGLLRRATGEVAKSAFVAALFAVHPLHVEPVAWVAERKEVLSALFWMLTLGAYGWYARRPTVARYLAVLAPFACGLMAKPMIVTLPFALLLLDWWPLQRIEPWRRLVAEKIPLIVLAAAAGIVTITVQQSLGALPGVEAIPPALRVANALTSYITYVGRVLWPAGLAAFYPYRSTWPAWWVLCGVVLLLVLMTLLAIRLARRQRYVIVGWLWYLGTLVPVIGLVQSGEQAMADRFVYIPLVGLLVIVAWGVPEVVRQWSPRRAAFAVAAAAAVGACAITARLQVNHWADNLALWEHDVAVTGPNAVGEINLAMALEDAGRGSEAVAHYLAALRVNPRLVDAHNNLGLLLASQGRMAEAIAHYSEALRANPNDANAHLNLGKALAEQGTLDEARAHFSEAVRLNPGSAQAHNNLANVLASDGRTADAISHYTEALRLRPGLADAQNGLGGALVAEGRLADAIGHFEEAIRLEPGFLSARHNLATVLAQQGRIEEAIRQLQAALEIDPADATARRGLETLSGKRQEE
jgi:tetratricopeptide (TPR) repeat protein